MERSPNSDYLDGIRGLAVLVVLLGHASNFGMDIIPGVDLRATAKAGVWLFFILSAFLLTRRLRDEILLSPVEALKSYLIKRGMRILPLYSVVLAFCVLVGWMPAPQALSHIALAEGRDHFWTIVVEMTFYAVLPLAVVFLRTQRQYAAFFFLALIVSLSAGADKIAQNSLMIAPYLAFFAAGMLISVMPVVRLKAKPATAVCGIAIISVVAMSPRMISFIFGLSVEEALAFAYLHIVPWCAVLACSAQSPMFASFLRSAMLRSAGKLSFAAYLIHYPIFSIVAATEFASIPFIGAITLAVVATLSAVLYISVERPLMRLASTLAFNQYRDKIRA